jgi:peptidoglycan/LPS O-acetylase OafA/YrhL
LSALSSTLSTDVAIGGFFVISGYLVLMSYDHSASLRDYFEKRIRRVYPAYALAIIASGVAGAFLTTLPLVDYAAQGLISYWIANLAFLNFVHPNLPGVFTGNPHSAVNGALWTLKIEVLFYAALPLIAAAIRSDRRWIVYVPLYASSLAYRAGMLELYNASGDDLVLRLSRQLPGQLVYFTVGMGSILIAIDSCVTATTCSRRRLSFIS